MWDTPFGLQCGFPERIALVKHNNANKSFSPDVWLKFSACWL